MDYVINRVEVLLPIVNLALIALMDVATGADYGSKPEGIASFSQILSSKIVIASDAVEYRRLSGSATKKAFILSLFNVVI